MICGLIGASYPESPRSAEAKPKSLDPAASFGSKVQSSKSGHLLVGEKFFLDCNLTQLFFGAGG